MHASTQKNSLTCMRAHTCENVYTMRLSAQVFELECVCDELTKPISECRDKCPYAKRYTHTHAHPPYLHLPLPLPLPAAPTGTNRPTSILHQSSPTTPTCFQHYYLQGWTRSSARESVGIDNFNTLNLCVCVCVCVCVRACVCVHAFVCAPDRT